MLTHVVMLKLQDEHKDKAGIIREKLMQLPSQIDVIKHYEVGLNIIESSRSYDMCLYSKFDSRATLDVYSNDPRHIEVVNYIKSVASSIIATDYES